MSIENLYRSREGIEEINKITNFIGNLVIKNEYEARKAETNESIAEYHSYMRAYTGTDTFDDYSKSINKYAPIIRKRLSKSPYYYEAATIDNLLKADASFLKDNLHIQQVKDYLKELRVARIYFYDEKNLYYRQFLGLPNSDKDIILVKNEDSFDPDAKIAIHLIRENLYPNTYQKYFVGEIIKKIYNENPKLNYLRFINKGLSPFKLRELPNYSIIYSVNGYLTDMEYSYFLKSYNKARGQVLMDYIDGFDERNPLYNVLAIQNLLYFTVLNYSNTYLERYSLHEYTERNLNDILDSRGYHRLKKIKDIELKKRIVKNLDDLITNKANNYVLDIILNKIIKDNNSEIRRYYLEKQYRDGSDHQDPSIEIDTSKHFEDSVKLVFREDVIISNKQLSDSGEKYHDYDSFVHGDNLWGGIDASDKIHTKELIKKQLLSTNFNSILTRYITLTKTVDIIELQRNLRDMLYLMLNYVSTNQLESFYNDKITFNIFECTPAALFAAMCWLQQMKHFPNPEKIISSNCIIASSAVFRRFGDLKKVVGKQENYIRNGKVIDITPSILDWNVVDYLKGDDEISTIKIKDVLRYEEIKTNIENDDPGGIRKEKFDDFLFRYRFYDASGEFLGEVDGDTKFDDLVNDYNNQYKRITETITRKMFNTADKREYEAWLFLLNQNVRNNSIEMVFRGYKTFPEFIKAHGSGNLFGWINKELPTPAPGERRSMEKICTMLESITQQFVFWTNNNFSENVYKNSLEEMGSKYVDDMLALFNEFVSVYSELYYVKYNYSLGGESDSTRLQLFYNPLNIYIKEKIYDRLDLKEKISFFIEEAYEDMISLSYDSIIDIETIIEDSINGELKIDPLTKQYIINILRYELELHIQSIFYDKIDLMHRMVVGITDNTCEDSVSLGHQIEILEN